MKKYIDKSALVAEIERRITNIKGYCLREGHDTRFDVVPEQLSQILSFIDALEVKEIDLEKEVNQYFETTWPFEEDDEDIIAFARHFFELGLKAQKGD